MYCSIYASPEASTVLIIEALEFLLDNRNERMVIAGDFNVDFNLQSAKRDSILNTMHSQGLQSSLPAHIQSSTRENTLIDNIFTDCDIIESGRYISLTSYHEPLWLHIDI